MVKSIIQLIFLLLGIHCNILAQDISVLVNKTRMKIENVKDYEANGTMKTNVIFLKLPVAVVKVYYRKPNQFKLKSQKGISFVPKGSLNFNLNSLFAENDFTILDAGSDKIDNIPVRVAKLLPNNDNGDLILSTLYIDPVRLLILKSKTTTKENGTYDLKMRYNKYAQYGLPDEILFSFNIKDYKLPKGVTFDFDDRSAEKNTTAMAQNKKGEVKIIFSGYEINKGLPDNVFK